MYLIERESYIRETKIINELEALNIKANIIIGGVAVYPEGKFQEKVLLDFAMDHNLLITNRDTAAICVSR